MKSFNYVDSRSRRILNLDLYTNGIIKTYITLDFTLKIAVYLSLREIENKDDEIPWLQVTTTKF